jgi:UDP-N-acetylmuramyl pentapeptide phosphotransferase/UDP-N-acetylglucosamine-1-phosphate transferase
VLIIGLPILDVVFSVFRRISKHSSPARADFSHIHHKLIAMGLSQKSAVILLYITSAVLGLCGFIFANKNYFSAVILLILLPVFVFVFAKYLAGDKSAKNNPPDNGGGSDGSGNAALADSEPDSGDVRDNVKQAASNNFAADITGRGGRGE